MRLLGVSRSRIRSDRPSGRPITSRLAGRAGIVAACLGSCLGSCIACQGSPAKADTSGPVAVSFAESTAVAASAPRPGSPETPPQVTAIGVRARPSPATADAAVDVLLLIDTSASQTGIHRQQANDAVSAVLQAAPARARFRVAAIDVSCEPLSKGFFDAGDEQLQDAVRSLDRRAPLGSTDLVGGIEAALDLFGEPLDDGPRRRILYIGDGPGLAGVEPEAFAAVLSRLRAERTSFSAVGVGPQVNWPLLAATASGSGGMLAVPDTTLSATEAGRLVAGSLAAGVLWPSDVVVSSTQADFGGILPRAFPPLRADRETVVLVDGPAEGVRIDMRLTGELPGDDDAGQDAQIEIPSAAPSSDNAYLAELARNARDSGGIFLPLLGRKGLDLARGVIRNEATTLVALGRQAEAAGDSEAALRLAEASLRRDPDNPTAAQLRRVAMKQVGGGPLEPPAPLPAPGRGLDDPDNLVDELENTRRVRVQALEQETAVALRESRRLMQSDPREVVRQLKLLLQRIETEFEDLGFNPATRDRLARQVRGRIREADFRGREKAERDLAADRAEAARRERTALLGELQKKQDRLARLASRYDMLVKEGIRTGYQRPTDRFVEAERRVAVEFAEQSPRLPTSPEVPMTARISAETMPLVARMLDHDAENYRLRRDFQRGFTDSLHLVDVAKIPFPDEPPILYPTPERWNEITRMREKYKSVDLANPGSAEQKIYSALEEPVENFDFVETPLRDVVAQIEDAHGIQVELDVRSLEDFGIDLDTPITKNLSGISLRSALRLALGELDLAYLVKDEVLLITTSQRAEEDLVIKVYPVADLVLPVNPSSGLNPFQTGGGLGGANAINSGQGGGLGAGLGGGGMGGGGMGGGMFQVADARTRSAVARAPEAADSSAERSAPGLPAEILADDDPVAALRDYLGEPPAEPLDRSPDADAPAAAASRRRLAELRATAVALGREGDFERAADLLSAAIAAGHAEPWMYEALAVALEAAGRPQAEVERALLSSADFATTPTDLLRLAEYLARFGCHRRSLEVCRRVTLLEPRNRQAFALAMGLADKLLDTAAVQWACSGVLRHDWPASEREIAVRAGRLARATIRRLEAEGEAAAAESFARAIDEALIRDLDVLVSWTGDADVDLVVEEPPGTVCSVVGPQSASGGMLLADEEASLTDAMTDSLGGAHLAGDATSCERYVATEGFPGTYRVLVRRITGSVAGDTITAEVTVHRGTSAERRMRKQLAVGGDEILLEITVPNGRRREPLEEAALAEVVQRQVGVSRSILAQQLAAMADPEAKASLARSRGPDGGATPPIGFGGRSAVGYQPIISTLPEGVNLFARAVVSADRRYVRITSTPLFSRVGNVTQFNFTSGVQAQGNQPDAAGAGQAPGAGALGGGGGVPGGAAGGVPGAAGGGAAGGVPGAAGGGAAGGGAAGGVPGAAGGGGIGGICWVAREVYGDRDPRWLLFRGWLLTDAPDWLRRLYISEGRSFAAWLHDKPAAKAAVRWLMDRAIAGRQAATADRGQSTPQASGWPRSE
jgi:hypothetical protein